MNNERLLWVSALILALTPVPVHACHDGSPLILDLNGDGIHTTELSQAVLFDIDGDGAAESLSWTNPRTEEGFLYLDLNRDGQVNDGGELFGDATLLPSGEAAKNGFLALAVYDQPEYGGNADRIISDEDWVWESLGVWVDRNHDGVSQRVEMRPVRAFQIEEIALDHEAVERMDGNLNVHRYIGVFSRRLRTPGGSPSVHTNALHDVFFRIAH